MPGPVTNKLPAGSSNTLLENQQQPDHGVSKRQATQHQRKLPETGGRALRGMSSLGRGITSACTRKPRPPKSSNYSRLQRLLHYHAVGYTHAALQLVWAVHENTHETRTQTADSLSAHRHNMSMSHTALQTTTRHFAAQPVATALSHSCSKAQTANTVPMTANRPLGIVWLIADPRDADIHETNTSADSPAYCAQAKDAAEGCYHAVRCMTASCTQANIACMEKLACRLCATRLTRDNS